MTKRTWTPTILALLIVAALAGAYLIVTTNNSAMNAGRKETPSGFFH